jgi:hypothetical protein
MRTRHLQNRRLWVEELETRLAPATTASFNWAGYAVAAGPAAVTAVSGRWVVPAVSGSGTAYSSTWVGIDGYNSPTVEQIGTDSDLYNGKPSYYAWFEMYPSYSVTLPLQVTAGDTIDAQVTYGSGNFTLSLTDTPASGSGHTYTTTKSAPSAARSSAEWIEEAPSSGGILPLANFGTATFTRGQATIGGTSGPIDNSSANTQTNAINMITSSGAPKASTSGLDATGSSFSVTWVSSGTSTRHHGAATSGTQRDTNQPQTQPTQATPAASSLVAAANASAAATNNAITLALLLQNLRLAFAPTLPPTPPVTSTAISPAVVPTFSQPLFFQAAPPLSARFPDSGAGGTAGVLQPIPAQPSGPATPEAGPEAVPAPPPVPDEGSAGEQESARNWRTPGDPSFLESRWVPTSPADFRLLSDPGEGMSSAEAAGALVLTFAWGASEGIGSEEDSARRRRRLP